MDDLGIPTEPRAKEVGDSSRSTKATDGADRSAVPERTPVTVRGYDFNNGVNWDGILSSMVTTGFQATSMGRAIEEVNSMLDHRFAPQDTPLPDSSDPESSHRPKTPITIFLSYTSNMISCGVRETIRFLVEHRLVDCLVTTAGGIEEDIIKCLAPTILGGFELPGAKLRKSGLNRIGNLLVPNDNYVAFEEWVMKVLDECWKEQQEDGVVWTPSKLINRLGREINDPNSVYYWAWKNNIPVFCPALTDGSLGDMLYLHSYKHSPPLTVDLVRDVRAINELSVWSHRVGCVILGGGVAKHHTLNACMMRNGAEHCVLMNTAMHHDGSDAGASPDEAVSWGKVRSGVEAVKVWCEASLAFPILVGATWAKRHWENSKEKSPRSH
ncbi:Deoxyhypusine synthase [Gonapodya prolifera JEL478]|uniref:deoxyhypusine synthase n=1 Tax=Gonapodya prolifera (strain JEL478) TaxID=1344416 RepID=A0A138ZZG2_GONPJ|nr:Deoxyhypusine synthase [Gonapodya prolifera JEL478]|eukprot:KXS09880.1 Deoxyhypusine synthase [Gonapodya prolifera JEL478]